MYCARYGEETDVDDPAHHVQHAGCGYCRRLKVQLDREGIRYSEVDIERDAAAADYVMTVNAGNQTVPTVVFRDGRSATNPTLAEVMTRLDSGS